ncbi:MAG TPA: prefoldin subunit alpha [Candidatus Nanoarchaeia archaeon]|nr:prefoldin subunit alpha [Candidatus Nanoarchaeia archaeon]
MENEQQELLFKLSMFEQQIRQVQQQINAVDEGISELEILNIGLNEIDDGKDKEIFAPVGRGIFVKAKILSEKLSVDVGGKNFVKKSVPETQEMIKRQIEKLGEIKKELDESLREITKEVEMLINENKS